MRAGAALGRAGRGDQRGVDHDACFQQQALGAQRVVDDSKHLRGQIVLLQPMAKPQDGALVRQPDHASGQLRKLTKQGHVEQRFFHGRIAQREPLLQEVDAQHRPQCKRRTAHAAGLALGSVVRFDQGTVLGPRHHALHLLEKLALARALGTEIKTQIGLLHRIGSAAVSVFTSAKQPVRPWTGFAEIP
jgi:hypothetical protein